MYIFRDINVNFLNDEVDSVKSYLNRINDFGLKNLIKVPTRVNSKCILIDLFYCSCPEKVTNSYVLLPDISDHLQQTKKKLYKYY